MSKKRYSKPAPGKKKSGINAILIRLFEKHPGVELTHQQICSMVEARDPMSRQVVFEGLNALASKNAIKRINHFTYSLNGGSNLVEGVIQLTQRGAGFVVVEGKEKDVFIAPQNIGQALNGDTVKVRVFKSGPNRDEGAVVEIKERERVQFVGTIQFGDKTALLIPDNNRSGLEIRIPKENLNGARDGEKALVKITVWPKSAEKPFGEVVAILGMPGSNDTEMLSILYNQGINPIFPDAVLDEAERVPVELDDKEIATRRNFRQVLTFTIDPFDARDFDLSLIHISEPTRPCH
jgi:ribonuclease R